MAQSLNGDLDTDLYMEINMDTDIDKNMDMDKNNLFLIHIQR